MVNITKGDSMSIALTIQLFLKNKYIINCYWYYINMMTFIVVFFYIAYLKAFYLPHLLLINIINEVIFRNKKISIPLLKLIFFYIKLE